MLDSSCTRCELYRHKDRLCAVLTRQQLRHLHQFSSPIELSRKTVLQAKSSKKWPITAVIEGTIGVQHILDDGHRTDADLYTAGDIIDLRLLDANQQHNLIALTKAKICRLDTAAFDDVTRANSSAQALVTNAPRH